MAAAPSVASNGAPEGTLADDTTAKDPLALARLVDRHGATMLTVVPSLLSTLAGAARYAHRDFVP